MTSPKNHIPTKRDIAGATLATAPAAAEANRASCGMAARLQNRRLELTALAAISGLYFWSYFHRVAVPGTVFNELQGDLGLSAKQVTGLGAVLLYIYASAQLFVGIAADRFGGTRVLLLGGIGMCVGAILFPLSHSLWMLYANRAMLGLGASLIFLAATKEVDALFGPRHFAIVVGLLLFMGNLGGLTANYPLERVVAAVGWRRALLGAGLLTVVAWALTLLVLRRVRHIASRGKPFKPALLREVLFNRRALPMLICGPVNFGIFFTLQTIIGKKFLEDFAQLSSAAAAGITSVLLGGTILVNLVIGYLSLRMGNRRKPIIVAGCLLSFLGSTMLLLGVHIRPHPALFLLAFLALALANGISPVGLAAAKELNRPESAGLAVALVNFISYVSVAVASNFSGIVLDHFKDRAVIVGAVTRYPREAYAAIFLGLVAAAGCSIMVSWFVPETHGRPHPALPVSAEAA